MIPVMSNSGSGNQGICATNPVAVYAEENENTEEELIRALTSHLHLFLFEHSFECCHKLANQSLYVVTL